TWLSQILSYRVRGPAMAASSSVAWSLLLRGVGGGFRRRVRCDRVVADMERGFLGDARRLAAAAAQIIQLGAPHRAAPHHLDAGDPRAVEREHALDALAVRDLAHREARIDPGIAAP